MIESSHSINIVDLAQPKFNNYELWPTAKAYTPIMLFILSSPPANLKSTPTTWNWTCKSNIVWSIGLTPIWRNHSHISSHLCNPRPCHISTLSTAIYHKNFKKAITQQDTHRDQQPLFFFLNLNWIFQHTRAQKEDVKSAFSFSVLDPNPLSDSGGSPCKAPPWHLPLHC